MSTVIKKKIQKLKGEKICVNSSSLISDNFLPFILLLIFLHSDAHGSQAFRGCKPFTSEELLSISNKFFFIS